MFLPQAGSGGYFIIFSRQPLTTLASTREVSKDWGQAHRTHSRFHLQVGPTANDWPRLKGGPTWRWDLLGSRSF